ncbi:hypothetical protein VNI00_018638 [Paramarasmius palmivorus]|uniref:PUM-HD domain-containing protein n=1 Tax=Paramarasmius palmivorus TaxID=297713 RepID=A0AAW0AWC0_9AGAR
MEALDLPLTTFPNRQKFPPDLILTSKFPNPLSPDRGGIVTAPPSPPDLRTLDICRSVPAKCVPLPESPLHDDITASSLGTPQGSNSADELPLIGSPTDEYMDPHRYFPDQLSEGHETFRTDTQLGVPYNVNVGPTDVQRPLNLQGTTGSYHATSSSSHQPSFWSSHVPSSYHPSFPPTSTFPLPIPAAPLHANPAPVFHPPNYAVHPSQFPSSSSLSGPPVPLFPGVQAHVQPQANYPASAFHLIQAPIYCPPNNAPFTGHFPSSLSLDRPPIAQPPPGLVYPGAVSAITNVPFQSGHFLPAHPQALHTTTVHPQAQPFINSGCRSLARSGQAAHNASVPPQPHPSVQPGRSQVPHPRPRPIMTRGLYWRRKKFVKTEVYRDFISDDRPVWTLQNMKGHIIDFCADQDGSKFIQAQLESASAEEKQWVFEEIFPHFVLQLVQNLFGSFVVVKLFSIGTPSQKDQLVDILAKSVFPLTLEQPGCRVIQRVVQDLMRYLPAEELDFMLLLEDHAVELSTNFTASRVVQFALLNLPQSVTAPLAQGIYKNARRIMKHEYGNYVVQKALQTGGEYAYHMITQQFASQVCDKLVLFAPSGIRRGLVDELLKGFPNAPLSTVSTLMIDNIGNYVLQKAVEGAELDQQESLLTCIEVLLPMLSQSCQSPTEKEHLTASK